VNIQRDPFEPDVWHAQEAGREYFISVKRSAYGPHWVAMVLVMPKGDRRPYWRPLKNWQRFACAARAFECRNTRDK
jgi:hypothetical protein